MKATILGLAAASLLSASLAADAAPMYSGTGRMIGTVVENNYPTGPNGQYLAWSCENTYEYDLTSIVADVGAPSVTLRSWTAARVSSVYLDGPEPEGCQTSDPSDLPEFPFRNVNASDTGLSGSNSAGTLAFDWSYNEDRTTLSGPISRLFFEGAITGTAMLNLVQSVPEPGTLALLGLGLAGLGFMRRRVTA